MAEEAPSGEQVPVTHIVVTVHAIRTYGEWQGRLEELVAERLRDSPPAARPLFCHYRYGFFSLLAFYFAPTRWLQVRRFRTDLERLIGRYPAVERIDIFAHSFGTYLASWALGAKPRSKTLPRVANLVLAGSVLRRTHPWLDWIDRRVSRVVNECGDLDHVLLLNQLVVPFAGAGGLLGFPDIRDARSRSAVFPDWTQRILRAARRRCELVSQPVLGPHHMRPTGRATRARARGEAAHGVAWRALVHAQQFDGPEAHARRRDGGRGLRVYPGPLPGDRRATPARRGTPGRKRLREARANGERPNPRPVCCRLAGGRSAPPPA